MLARLRQFRFDWKLTALTALLLPVLVSLGFWQLAREAEKRELQDLYTSRQQQAPVELQQLDPGDDLQYRQVHVGGSWDNEHVFLLDNRIYQGQTGFEVLVPLRTGEGNTASGVAGNAAGSVAGNAAGSAASASNAAEMPGTVVFINRGWIPQGQYRQQLPDLALTAGHSQVHGSIYVPIGEAFTLGAEPATGSWPRIIQTADPAIMARLAGFEAADTRIFPYTVRLGEGSPGVLTRYWPVISTTPEKHRGYAVQWFAMALMLLGLYLYYSTRPDSPADDTL